MRQSFSISTARWSTRHRTSPRPRTTRSRVVISQATIRSAVGLGARVMIEEALRRAGAAEDIDEMLAEVLVHYEANIAAESRPFPGAVASLEMLAKAGQGSRCARTSANISRASCSRRL